MEHHRCAKNARSLRFSLLEVSNLGDQGAHDGAPPLREECKELAILSPRGLQGVSPVRTFFNALGSLEEDLVYNWTCRRKTVAKTKETGTERKRTARCRKSEKR